MLELEESMRAEKDFNNHFAKTVLLSENCEVLHEENVAFYRKESALQEHLVMNQLGHLLQIHTIKCVAESKTEVQPHKHPLNDSQVTYVAIPSESRLQIAFAGSYVCYVATDKKVIKYLDSRIQNSSGSNNM